MREFGDTPPPAMNVAFTRAAARVTLQVSVCSVSPLGPLACSRTFARCVVNTSIWWW